MEPERTINPGVGVNAFEVGMTRDQLWTLTDSDILAFHVSGAAERFENFLEFGIHVEYWNQKAHNFTVFPRLPNLGEASIILLEEDICRFGREDLQTLIQLHELSCFEELGKLFVPRLGLEFEFRQDHGQAEVLEFVLVAAPREDVAD